MFKKSIFKKSILVGAILSLLAAPFAVGTSVKAAESSDLEKVQIRAMSYNIHHAAGSDGKLDLKRIGDIIKDSNADIIGLQEVDNNFGPRSNFEDQARRLSEYLGMEFAYGANLNSNGHQYGTAVLSKYPIVSSENHLLFSMSEQRGLLETVIDVKGTQFRFFNTHLDWERASERTQQIKEILEWGGKNEGPAIFVGDFNALPDSAEMQPMMQAYNDVFGSLGQNEDYTVPGMRIDYIFASENIVMQNADVLLTETTRVASDHLPIIADLIIGLTETKLNSITAPADITDVAIGTANTADALGLPAKVMLVTDLGYLVAGVNWDVDRASYNPTATTAQTFTVNGTVNLPPGVLNPDNVPLTTSIGVTVDKIPARTATVTASSYYNASFTPNKVFDGIGQAVNGEWASKGEQNPWIQVNWTANQTFNKIVFYDRPNSADWAPGGTLTFSDGSTLTVSGIPNDGSAYSVTFPDKTATWVKFQVSGGSGPNVGLSEMKFIAPVDKEAPEVEVTVPGDNSIYEDSGDLTPQIKLTDNLSGVDTSKTTVTLDSQSYQIGTAIPLYKLPLGQHTLVVSASDLVGNQASKTVRFTTVASNDSLKALVTRFANNKEIDKADIATNLLGKLASNNLKGFMNDVKAQSGKHISSEAANYLLRDAQYVLTQK
ncbi:DUF7402 domain-containing protein [Paenibacillus spongiae]|uniref:Endonuclease/exonuclease/phosphatase family protein n=1 Tax=Paenibacillus spongiae TaxID=2909671 RepID=A0ABY5S9I0_9BACL|nr:endonuclease/exonuclease/phosphatase family protein [Paenibacillus spongiae]UVI29373.1 endonuclease/exonuclease/phosphatase family protein [Paenibacillus spongiae]